MKKIILGVLSFMLTVSLIPVLLVNNAFAVTGQTHKVLTVLVNFTDSKIKYSDSEWNKKLFGQGMKSLKDFYLENSNNLYNLIPAEENSGVNNDGIVRVNLNMVNPNAKDGPGTRGEAIKAAVAAASPYVNFNNFGKELKIIVIFAGEGTNLKTTPCNFPRVLPNIIISTLPEAIKSQTVASMGELYNNNEMIQLGGIVHEFGHVLGFIDLYPIIDNQSTMGKGGFGTISIPGDCPAHLDPWSKIKAGFVEAKVVTKNGFYPLNAASTGRNGIYNTLKIPNPTNQNEYYLIEKRDFKNYDKGLEKQVDPNNDGFINNVSFFEQGIYVWHIDESMSNNNDVGTYKNNKVTLVNTLALPFVKQYGSFTSYTSEQLKFNDGTSLGLTISIADRNFDGTITEADATGVKISFKPTVVANTGRYTNRTSFDVFALGLADSIQRVECEVYNLTRNYVLVGQGTANRIASGQWKFTVDSKNYNDFQGEYYVEVYTVDTLGNRNYMGDITTNLDFIPPTVGETLIYPLQTNAYKNFDVIAELSDISGISQAKMEFQGLNLQSDNVEGVFLEGNKWIFRSPACTGDCIFTKMTVTDNAGNVYISDLQDSNGQAKYKYLISSYVPILGSTKVGSKSFVPSADYFVAYKATAAKTTTINELNLLMTDAIGNVRMGIFESSSYGEPGKCLAQTGDIKLINGWNSGKISPVTLTAGKTYWLGFVLSQTGSKIYYNDLISNGRYTEYGYGTLPSNVTFSMDLGSGVPSFYASFSN